MRYLVLADIHGNMPALRAVLAHPEARGCDRVLSLGDHTGFGPEPRQAQETLERLGAVVLLGNHEDRLNRIHDQQFAGYNWELLRWTKEQMAGLNTRFPTDMRIGPVLLTHGAPGDPFRLMDPATLPPLMAGLPGDVRFLVSGHNHTAWQVSACGREAFNPGSLGLSEDGVGGNAPFGVMTVEGEDVSVKRYVAPYDLDEVRRAFVRSGAAKAAPELCRSVLDTMTGGLYQNSLKFVRSGLRVAQERGLPAGDAEVWQETARRWWPDDTLLFWKRMEETLL